MDLTGRWWETASAVVRVSPKHRGQTLVEITADLGRLQGLGFDVIELFAPCAGGTAYEGLDTIDFWSVDPKIGTFGDVVALVDAAHRRGMAVVAFLNVGYVNEAHPAFLQGCDDVRQGIDSPVSRWFRWSDTGQDVLGHPEAPFFRGDLDGSWAWSDRAQRWYWVKWRGEHGDRLLPQLDFADPGWQAEVRRILAFWAAAGFDGIVTDAVNWYLGADWDVIRSTLVDVPGLDDLLLHPEGAGGFTDDPVVWVETGGFQCIMDYALNLWWEGVDVVGQAVATGDPSGIEPALRGYRDRVVAAGGMCYVPPGPLDGQSSAANLLRIVTIATVGELPLDHTDWWSELAPADGATLSAVLEARRHLPVLGAVGARLSLGTDDPHMLAFLRRWDRDETQVLVVLNFAATDGTVRLHDPRIAGRRLIDLVTGVELGPREEVTVRLPAHGFVLLAVQPPTP